MSYCHSQKLWIFPHLQRIYLISVTCDFVPHFGDVNITIYLVSFVITTRPASLVASNRACVFLYGIYVFTQCSNIINTVQELMCSIQFQSFPMAYSKANLKSNGNKESPCFRPYWIGNASDTFLSTWSLLQVLFKYISTGLTSFIGIPNSTGTLYNTSLFTELQAFSKSINNCYTIPLHSYLFFSIWQMQNMWSLRDLLQQDPH